MLAIALSGCQREERKLRLAPPTAATLEKVKLMPSGISGTPQQVYFAPTV